MSKFIRHIGKIGDRKIAVVFREVPDEPHMALVVYTQTLHAHLHDALMQCIDGDIGQHSEHLADALNRSYTKDGKIILQVLHAEGMLKKVQTSTVTMTPGPNTAIRLDELNKILDDMQQGEKAVERLKEMDASRGMQSPVDVARRMKESNQNQGSTSGGLISDSALASQRLAQATKMEAEAKGLLAESLRLREEAKTLDPTMVEKVTEAKPTQPIVKRHRKVKQAG
jgi:hypothetical protein